MKRSMLALFIVVGVVVVLIVAVVVILRIIAGPSLQLGI